MRYSLPSLLLLCALVAGCATSNDPRQGGLIGYWSTGEKGYQQRLAERRNTIVVEQAAAEKAAQERADLESRKKAQAEALARLEADMARMSTDLDGLEKDVGNLANLSAERTAERDRLLSQLAGAQVQMKALQGNPEAELAGREARLAELTAEVKALRQKASLLLGQ
jgi:chromosome segregation ATPase